MTERFYLPPGPALQTGRVTLTGEEAHHLAVVRRLRCGDSVCLFTGDGHEYGAEIVAVQRRAVELHVREVRFVNRELPFRLVVAAPLPKGDRTQFLIEKLTELGVTAFVPLRTARSVLDVGPAKLSKLQRYVIEASKQCGRNTLMEIAQPGDWAGFCSAQDLPSSRLLAHPEAPPPVWPQQGDLVVAVGPEGGWTAEEVAAAAAAGWQLVGLGPRILRIETAALVLAAGAALITGSAATP